MAANKMQFQYEVTANTSQAKKALADLDKALDRLNKQQKLDMGLSQELTEAADAARLLQRELNAAMDVKTGKLNVSELARGLAQAGTSVEQLSTKFLNAGTMGEAAFRGLAQSIVTAEVPMKRMNKTLADAMTTLKNTVKWEISSTLVHGLEGAFLGAVSYAKNLNTSLTNIRIVTNQSIDDMVKFTKQANAAAKELSTTTKAYADASLIYYQQGDSQELAAKKAAITIKASNASFETSAKEMSEYLTSVWNSYQVGADELERYVDIMANLGAKTATSLEEIATSMQKVAATANTVGVSMEQVSSIIATVSSVTRESAESIGTSYKTIFARIGDLKLGKVDEDGVGLGQVSSQLDAIGVKILDESGNLREMGDIITDLGTKWQTMNEAQKTAVAQVVAGKRQYTQLMALFENWDMFQSNMNIAENSEGALQKMADIHAESWEAASARAKASMEGIFNQIINDQAIIKITNVFADLTDGIGDVIEGLGGIGGTFLSLGSIASKVFKDKIIVHTNDVVKSFTNLQNSIKGKKGLDIFSSLFGEPNNLKEYRKSLQELKKSLATHAGYTSNQGASASLINSSMQEVIEAKEKLLRIESRLSTAERERYQNSINNLNRVTDELGEQNQKYEEQEKSIKKIIARQASVEEQQNALQRSTPDQTFGSDKAVQAMQDRIKALFNDQAQNTALFEHTMFGNNFVENARNGAIGVKELVERIKDLAIASQSYGDIDQLFYNMSENIADQSDEERLERMTHALQDFRAQMQQIGVNTNNLDQFIDALSQGTFNTEQFDRVLQLARTQIDGFRIDTDQAEDAARLLGISLGMSETELRELCEQARQGAVDFRRLQAYMRQTRQASDDLPDGEGSSIGEVFAQFTQATMSAISAFSSFAALTENWDESSLTEKITSTGSALMEILTAGGPAEMAIAAISAAIGGVFGVIEKNAQEAQENIDRINESILESSAELEKSSQAADQAMENYEEASKQYEAGNLSQNDYLQIIDNVLGALDAEHLKVLALKGDYDGLRKAIEGANQERLAGDVEKAENLVNTGYYNLVESLNAYSGRNANTGTFGRNGINLDWNNINTETAMKFLGFSNYSRMFGLDQDNWSWEGNQSDLIQLQNNWEELQTDNKYKTFRESQDFAVLTEYMKQFDTVFAAMDTRMQTSAAKALSEYPIENLKSDKKAYEEILGVILTSFGTTAEEATPYQLAMARDIAKDWVANLSTGIQTGFYEGLNQDTSADTAQQYAQKYASKQGQQYIRASKDAILPTFLLTKNDNGELDNAISQQAYNDIEKYKNYISAWNATNQTGANIEALLASTGIDHEKIGIHLQDDQTIGDYLESASEQTKEALLENLRVEIDAGIDALGISHNSYDTQFEKIKNDLNQEIADFFSTSLQGLLEDSTGYMDTWVSGGEDGIKTLFEILSNKENSDLYRQAWSQLKFKEDGTLDVESKNKLMTSSLGLRIDENILKTMIDLQTTGLFDFDSAFEYVFSIWDGRIKEFESYWQDLATSTKVEVEKTQEDFNQLKQLDADHTKWDDDKFNMFSTQAKKYGVSTADWAFKTEAQQSQDVYNVMKSAFDQQWAGQNWTQADIEADPKGYSNYISNYTASLQELNRYALQETESSMKDLETNYSNIESILSTLMSLDLTKNIDETVVSAEKFAEIMEMSIDEFNSQYTTSSQKQLAFLKAQQKHSKKYADDLATQAQEWYDATGKELIEAGDMNAIQTWAILSQQVSEAQADAAESADNVNTAYASLNDEKIASIASQWERANKEAEKQQQIAQILGSSVDTGIISNEEAAIVGITADEWARYSVEARAALAAKQTHKANSAIIQTLNNEKKALEDTISYFEQHKQAFDRYIQDDNAFERALNRWNLSGEQIKTFREARTQAINNVGKDNADEILTEMSIILNIDKKELESQIKQTVASSQDTISDIYNSLSFELQSQAQEAVEVWRQAFDSIAEARKILLEGGSLVDMLGDPEEFQRIYEQYKKNNPNASVEDFKNGVIRGEITIEDIQMPEITDDYMKQIYKEQGLDGLESSRTKDRWIQEQELRKAGITKDAEIEQALATRYTNMFEKTTNLDSETIAEKVALIIAGGPGALEAYKELYSAVEEQKAILKGSEEIKYEGHEREETAIAVQEAADTGNLVINASGAIQVDGKTIEGSETIGLTRTDGKDSSFEEYTQLQEAISRAEQAKAKEQTWDTLDKTDRDLLSAYGINGFEDVDGAANECASALTACAKAAYQLALDAAGKQGYIKNQDGTFTKYNETTTDEEGNLIGVGEGHTVTAENSPVVKAVLEAEQSVKEAEGNEEDLFRDSQIMRAEAIGSSREELIKYGEVLNRVSGDQRTFEQLTRAEQEQLFETARQAKLAAEGQEELNESQKKNIDILKKGDKTTTEYIDALTSLTSSVKKQFGDSEKVTEDFVEKHLDLVEEMAKGSREAAEEFEKQLLMEDLGDDYTMPINFDVNSDGAIDQLDTLGDFLNSFGDEFANKPIGFTIEADDSAAIQALNELLASGAITVDQMNDLLATIGWIPEIEEEVVEGHGSGDATVSGEIVGHGLAAGAEGSIEGEVHSEQSGDITIPTIKSVKKTGGGASGIKKPSGGGKGGGGGSKPQKKEKKPQKRYQDEIERYHKNNETLSRISEELDKIDKLKDRAYGNKHIDQLNAETDALKEQLEAQQALHDEAKKYQAADQIAVARYGAQFDADGTIVNYEEVMRNIVDEYNRAVDVYNNSAQEDGDKERFEAAEQRFEDAKKSIEDYEEAIAKANESMNDMLETQNKISEIETEKITYKLELQIEMNERDLERFEYYQEKYEDSLKDQGIVYKSIYDSMLEYENNLAVIGEAMAALDQKRKDGLITDADYAETLQDLYDQIFENLGDLNEIQNELVDTYTNTLELAREEVEKTTDTIESANSALQSYLDIIALSGGETDYEKMAYFYEKMNENNLIKINIQRDHLNALLEEEDKFQEKIKSGQQLTDLEKKQYEALREEIQDTRDTLLSSTTEALEAIRTTYENTINGIAKDFEEFMVGAGDSIEHLQEQYGYFQEEQDNYVSTAKELYEVSKLNRDIEGALGDATSKAAKEALKALQEKINKQSELNQLTEYDIEMNQLQYELLMARIKLEESQNAKDVVRLTRDENGNYAYRYTANQDKIDEAAQNYEDILQQINETTAQRTSEIEGRMLETMAWAKEQMSAIAMDYTLTEEEKRDRLEELNNQFAAKMQYLHEQNGIATENLITNQEAIAEHYGVNLSEITSSTAGNVNTQIQSMIEKTQEYITKMNEALFGEGGADQSWKDYLEDIGIITSNAGTAYGDMVENTQEMGEMNHWSAEQAQEVIETLTDTLEPLETLTAAWDAHNSILEATISDYENLAQVIQGVLSAVGEIPNGGSATDVDGHAYAKGGMVDYTGLAWVDGSPSDPEMMLNPGDTQNILKATAMVKSLDSGFIGALVDSVKSAAQAMMHMFSGAAHAVTNIHPAATESLEQSVHITAEFPNVQDHNEIEEALLGLVNRSAQFANQKK